MAQGIGGEQHNRLGRRGRMQMNSNCEGELQSGKRLGRRFLSWWGAVTTVLTCLTCGGGYAIGGIPEIRRVGQEQALVGEVVTAEKCKQVSSGSSIGGYQVDPILDDLVAETLEGGPWISISAIRSWTERKKAGLQVCVALDYSRTDHGFLVAAHSSPPVEATRQRLAATDCHQPFFRLIGYRSPSYATAMQRLFGKLPDGYDGFSDVKFESIVEQYCFPLFAVAVGSDCVRVSGVPFRGHSLRVE